MTPLLAIDPGASGGIAYREAGGLIYLLPMPEGMTAQVDALRAIAANHPTIRAIVERVGCYMPGNAGPAAATFARHCGHLEAALYCLGVPTEQVAPQKWMKTLGALPKEKPERKKAIKEIMARRYPYLTITLKTADALAILEWWKEQQKGEA